MGEHTVVWSEGDAVTTAHTACMVEGPLVLIASFRDPCGRSWGDFTRRTHAAVARLADPEPGAR